MAAYKAKKIKLDGYKQRAGAVFGPPKLDGYPQKPAPAVDKIVATAPPPKPAAPPGPQPLPFDSLYESEVSNAHRQFDTTNAGLQYQWGRTKQEYGFDDASDPFSRARMLERNFQQATRKRLNTSGNNLYSSSFTRGESEGRFGYERDVNTTRRAYDDEVQALKQRYLQAQTDRDTTKTSAGAERIRRASEDRQAAEDRAYERDQDARTEARETAANKAPTTGPQAKFGPVKYDGYLQRPGPDHIVPTKKPKPKKPKKKAPKKKAKKSKFVSY